MMRRKMIYTGLCLVLAFVFGLQTSEAQREGTEVKSPKNGFSSPADRAKPLLNAEFVFKPTLISCLNVAT